MARRLRLTLGALLLASAPACGGGAADPSAGAGLAREPPAAAVLERNGYALAVPPGWDGRVLFRDAAGRSGVLFQAASFELPENDGLEPPPPLPPGHGDPIEAMDEGDVLVTIATDEPGGEPAPETIALDDLRFLPPGSPRVPVGHALAQGSFCRGARCFHVDVDFGGRTTPLELQTQVNRVLGSWRARRGGRRPGRRAACGRTRAVEKESFTND
jgi:hypothetical protein